MVPVTQPPIVTLKDGQAFANSRDVAEFFGKLHKHVLDTIDELVEAGVPDCRLTPFTHPQNGQTYRAFDMTKDGFTLLAMGFTGSKALQFKLAYIAAFNELEAEAHAAMVALSDLDLHAGGNPSRSSTVTSVKLSPCIWYGGTAGVWLRLR